MIEQEQFAHNIREAGEAVRVAEAQACQMEAIEKQMFARLQMEALGQGSKNRSRANYLRRRTREHVRGSCQSGCGEVSDRSGKGKPASC